MTGAVIERPHTRTRDVRSQAAAQTHAVTTIALLIILGAGVAGVLFVARRAVSAAIFGRRLQALRVPARMPAEVQSLSSRLGGPGE
jgi:hypothetical protein